MRSLKITGLAVATAFTAIFLIIGFMPVTVHGAFGIGSYNCGSALHHSSNKWAIGALTNAFEEDAGVASSAVDPQAACPSPMSTRNYLTGAAAIVVAVAMLMVFFGSFFTNRDATTT